MDFGNLITLSRTCEAIQIPSGVSSSLPSGTVVRIMQSRGTGYTVATEFGEMFRVDARDRDALGLSDAAAQTSASHDGTFSEQMVWDQLKTVYDPEIPVNIVDLGLIYDCHLAPAGQNSFKADVKMTLTAPGCGMGPMLAQDVQNKLLNLEPIDEANVELVWDPPWNQGMMTEAAKLQLGLM